MIHTFPPAESEEAEPPEELLALFDDLPEPPELPEEPESEEAEPPEEPLALFDDLPEPDSEPDSDPLPLPEPLSTCRESAVALHEFHLQTCCCRCSFLSGFTTAS